MAFDSDTLKSIAGAFELVVPPLPSGPGSSLVFEARGPASATEPLLGDPVMAPVNLDVVSRHAVVASMTDDTVTTEWPLPSNVLSELPAGTASENDVEAWITRVEGQVPVKIPEVDPTIRIRWTVERTRGREATAGVDYVLGPGGLESALLDIVFAPPLVTAPAAWPDLGQAPDPDLEPTYVVKLEVRVTAGAHDSGWVLVGEVDVPVVALPVPDLWVGFQHSDYEGAVFILLNGPLKVGDRFGLHDVLTQLQEVLERLRSIASFARWAAGIDLALDGIARWPTRSHFVEGSQIGDFKDWVLHPRSWTNFQDEWHDVLSSMVVVSVGQKLECFDDEDHEGAKLVIDPGAVLGPAVLIGTLHEATPATLPAGAVTESGNGYGGGGFGFFPWENDPDDWDWGDTIRSLRWVT
jgi:hypothetical protein